MKEYDAVIVGLGPTGGTLANLLISNSRLFNFNFRKRK